MPEQPSTRQSGLDHLISQLHAGGVEVMESARYLGADLVAQVCHGPEIMGRRPIKLSATRDPRFTLMRRFEKIPNVLLVYVCNALSDSQELYALSYVEAFRLLDGRDHTRTSSWIEDGGYSLRINGTWRDLLRNYRMQPKDWAAKIVSAAES